MSGTLRVTALHDRDAPPVDMPVSEVFLGEDGLPVASFVELAVSSAAPPLSRGVDPEKATFKVEFFSADGAGWSAIGVGHYGIALAPKAYRLDL